MKIVCWNCRGAASSDFRRNIKNLLFMHKPNIVIITEPRISGQRASQVINGIGYDGFEVVDPIGFSGGIWLLWRSRQSPLIS